MNIQNAIQQLESAQTGHELLNVLDNLQGGFKYIESPMIAQVLGIPTLEPIEFWWYNKLHNYFTQTAMNRNVFFAIAIVPISLLIFATVRDSCANPDYANYFQEKCQKHKWHSSQEIGSTILHLNNRMNGIVKS